MTLPTSRWPFAAEIRDELAALGTAHPTRCTVANLAEQTTSFPVPTVANPNATSTFQGNFIRLGRKGVSGTGTPRAVVLFTGGVHAREWAQPRALVTLVTRLLDAGAAGTGITIGTYTTITADVVRAIHEELDLVVAPLINSDGYQHSQINDTSAGSLTSREDRGWRKNRRPAPSTLPSGCTATNAVGVDVNRNFDVLWDFEAFYVCGRNGFQSGSLVVQSSKNPCDVTFIGPGPYQTDTPTPPTPNRGFTEAEARNVKKLLENFEPNFYVDCHMWSETIMFSWGVEENDPITSGPTPILAATRVRDGTRSGTALTTAPPTPLYREPISKIFRDEVKLLGDQMVTAIRTTGNTRYKAEPGAASVSISGACDDFSFSRNVGTTRGLCRAFTFEAGRSHLPDFASERPALEDEIHVGLLELLFRATSAGAAATSGSTGTGSTGSTGSTGTGTANAPRNCGCSVADPESDR